MLFSVVLPMLVGGVVLIVLSAPLSRDTADGSRTGENILVFPVFSRNACEARMAIERCWWLLISRYRWRAQSGGESVVGRGYGAEFT